MYCSVPTHFFLLIPIISYILFPLVVSGMPADMVAHYSFDQSAYDQSEYVNHGEPHGSSFTKDRFQRENNAIHFNAHGSYVDIRRVINDIKFLPEATISFWANCQDSLSHTIFQFIADNSNENATCINPLEFILSDYVMKQHCFFTSTIKLKTRTSNVKGFDIKISFDPNIIQPVDIKLNHLFNHIIIKQIDLENGVLHVVAAQIPISTDTPYDSLFTVKWQIIEPQPTCIDFVSMELADRNGSMIATCSHKKCLNANDMMKMTMNRSQVDLTIQMNTQLRNLQYALDEFHDKTPSDMWQFVTLTLVDDAATLFINGEQKAFASDMPYSKIFSNASHATIGSENSSDPGLILDDFKIFKHALSSEEIESLYEESITIMPSYIHLPADGGTKDIVIQNLQYTNNRKRYTVYYMSGFTSGRIMVSSDASWLQVSTNSDDILDPFRRLFFTADTHEPAVPSASSEFIYGQCDEETVHLDYSSNFGSERYSKLTVFKDTATYSINVIQAARAVTVSVNAPDLQQAIDQASPGSHIWMNDGTFEFPDAIVVDKAITISASSGPDNCTVYGAFEFVHTDSAISGLTIINPFGSGIHATDSTLKVKNCMIHHCLNHGLSSFQSELHLSNCVIVQNNRNGILARSSSVDITHCTMADNISSNITSSDTSIHILNSIIVHQQPGGLITSEADMLSIQYSNISDLDILNQISATNKHVTPLFVSPESLDYRLKAQSLCLDSGIDVEKLNQMACLDIHSQFRPQPLGSMPDLGAYESPLGHKNMYVVYPLIEEHFCIRQTSKIPLVWDTSDPHPFFRLKVYRQSVHPEQQIADEWLNKNYFFLSMKSLTLESNYFWTVEALPAKPDSCMVTGSFFLTNREIIKRSPDAVSFLFCFMETKKKINSVNTYFENKNYNVEVNYYKRYNTDIPSGWHRGMFLFMFLIQQRNKNTVTLSLADHYQVPSKSFHLLPFWYSVLIYNSNNGRIHWF